ncbi:unnamed protein product [Scytosiphon promiscuus]
MESTGAGAHPSEHRQLGTRGHSQQAGPLGFEEPSPEESGSPTMPAVHDEPSRGRRKDKSSPDAPSQNGGTRRRHARDSNRDASTLVDGAQLGGEETLAGAGGIGDAIGRGRRQEERAFLEVRTSGPSRCLPQGIDVHEALPYIECSTKRLEQSMHLLLVGRDWVWGPNGEILVLDVVPPEKIPVRVMPRVGAGSDGKGGDPVALRGDKDGRKGSGGVDVSGGRSGKAPSKGGAAGRRRKGSRSKEFFEMSATSQPPLLDSLDLQAGVCVKEGSQERQGPPFEEDRNHMPQRGARSKEPVSREPSLTLAMGPQRAGVTADLLPREGQSLDPPQNRRGLVAGDPLSPPATFPLRSASIPAGRGDNEHPSPGRNRLMDGVKTLDPLSGATRLEPSGVGSGAAGRGEGGYHRGRRLSAPEGAEQEGFRVGEKFADDPEDDPHWRLFKEGGNVSGGAAGLKPVPPPALPKKRGPRHKRGALIKPEPRRPRDRGTRLPISTVARKHLPPPPVGETMGHGLSPPRDRGPGRVTKTSEHDDGAWLSSPDRNLARNRKSNNEDDDDNNSAEDRGSTKRILRDAAALGLSSPRGTRRKRASGGGGLNAGARKRGGTGAGGVSGKDYPVLPGLKEAYLSSPPRAEGGGGMHNDGGVGGKKRRARRESALRMGWINARPSHGTLQELLRAT